MAAVSITNGGLKTGPDAADNYLTFSPNFQLNSQGVMEVLVQVVTATVGIKFSVSKIGGAINSDAYAAPAGYKQVFTFDPRIQELHYQCGVGTDAFNISQ